MERQGFAGQQAGNHQRQGCVFRAANGQRANQRVSTDNADTIHLHFILFNMLNARPFERGSA